MTDTRTHTSGAATPELLAELGVLLEEALDLEPVARPAWLAALRARSATLAAEIDALLAAEADLDSRGFLADGSSLTTAPAPSLAGRRLGAYTLDRPLGRGGMGSVWLARRSDGRYEGLVAIKLLNLALLDAHGAERFRREGTALARLTHPNIARLLDAGVSDDGQPFLVLEHIDGRRIDTYCDEERLSPERRLALFLQVLAAVEHAHASLIVHRDIKPSNILVTADGTVKLLDFGIAKLLHDGRPEAEPTELTDIGGAAMTPEYAAPEQIAGSAITTATDVYALGVLLYLLLAGRHPTANEGDSAVQRLRGVLDTEPRPLSTVAPERLRRTYRGDLDNIVARALEKRPADRYATAAAFADDLRRYLAHEPVLARRGSAWYRAAKFARRNRGALAAGVLVAATLVAATAVSVRQMVDARRQRDEARVQRDQAQLERQRAAATAGFMESVLQTVSPDGRPFTTMQLLDHASALLEKDYAGDPRLVARMLIDLAIDYATLEANERQMELLTRAVTLASRARDDESAAQAECAISNTLIDRGDSVASQHHLDEGLRHLALVRSPATRARVQCTVSRALIMSDYARALAVANEAVRLARNDGDTLSIAYIDALQAVIDQYTGPHRWRDALTANVQLGTVLEQSARGSSLLMMRTLVDRAQILFMLGEVRSADSVLRAAQALARRADPAYVGTTRELVMLGQLQLARGQPDSALASYERVAADSARRVGNPYWGSFAHERTFEALVELGRLDEARAELARQLAGGTPTPGFAEYAAARLAEVGGDTARAYALYLEAATAEAGVIGGMNSASTILVAARLALAQGKPLVADSLVQRAIAACHEFQHSDTRSRLIGRALALEARVRLAQGDTAAARDVLRRAIVPLDYSLGPESRPSREARTLLAEIGDR